MSVLLKISYHNSKGSINAVRSGIDVQSREIQDSDISLFGLFYASRSGVPKQLIGLYEFEHEAQSEWLKIKNAIKTCVDEVVISRGWLI